MFIHDPVGIPLLNAWVRVGAALPDISERMREAVELDNE
jgi:glucosyl-3-phosphoglycerate synthase